MESGGVGDVILARFGDHDRGDKTRCPTTGDRASTPTDNIGHRTPAVAPIKQLAGASPIRRPTGSANHQKNGAKKQNNRGYVGSLDISIIVSLRLRTWR